MDENKYFQNLAADSYGIEDDEFSRLYIHSHIKTYDVQLQKINYIQETSTKEMINIVTELIKVNLYHELQFFERIEDKYFEMINSKRMNKFANKQEWVAAINKWYNGPLRKQSIPYADVANMKHFFQIKGVKNLQDALLSDTEWIENNKTDNVIVYFNKVIFPTLNRVFNWLAESSSLGVSDATQSMNAVKRAFGLLEKNDSVAIQEILDEANIVVSSNNPEKIIEFLKKISGSSGLASPLGRLQENNFVDAIKIDSMVDNLLSWDPKNVLGIGKEGANFTVADIITAELNFNGRMVDVGFSFKLRNLDQPIEGSYVLYNDYVDLISAKNGNLIKYMRRNFRALYEYSVDNSDSNFRSYYNSFENFDREAAMIMAIPRFFSGFFKRVSEQEYKQIFTKAKTQEKDIYTVFYVSLKGFYLMSDLIRKTADEWFSGSKLSFGEKAFGEDRKKKSSAYINRIKNMTISGELKDVNVNLSSLTLLWEKKSKIWDDLSPNEQNYNGLMKKLSEDLKSLGDTLNQYGINRVLFVMDPGFLTGLIN